MAKRPPARTPADSRPGTARRLPGSPSRGHLIELTKSKGLYSAFGYYSARVADREGRAPTAGSADAHALLDRERLIHQSRDFRRNNGIYDGMIDRAATYIVGNGFSLQAKTGDPEWNRKAEAYFKAFWRRPEIRGVLSGRGVEQMVCEELLSCGDVGVLKTDQGKLQIFEAEQIVGPGLKDDGIKKDSFGKPLKYTVAPWGKSGGPQLSKARGYAPDAFLFIAKLRRPSASRGVPPAQASFPMLHRINDACDSEAIAMQMLARIALSITRPGAAALAFQTSSEDDTKSADSLAGDFASRIHEIDQAIIFHGEPGDEIKGVERNIPGKDFPQSVTMFLRLLGVPLGLPLELILLDWTKSNYSQSRAVLLQAFTTFMKWQGLLEEF